MALNNCKVKKVNKVDRNGAQKSKIPNKFSTWFRKIVYVRGKGKNNRKWLFNFMNETFRLRFNVI